MKIGVLGGIRPEATGIFYLRLIEKIQENGLVKSNEDFPQILINSIPAPELVFEKIEDKDLEPYAAGIRELDKAEPDFMVMVCNTIHLFHEKLQKETEKEIIDLRQEVRKALEKSSIQKATIIGTPGTIRQGLYNFPEISYCNPEKHEQAILSDAIFSFNKGTEKDRQAAITRKIIEKYLSSGSEIVVLACTEFAVMLKDADIPKLDTIDVLADGVIERIKKMT